MLKELYVKNVALIEEELLEFEEGLNVLSGETGSGKSVILDSINFILGSKADKNMIRYGEQDAFVRAVFFVEENSQALEALKGLDIETENTVIITRKITNDGRGTIKINGMPVTASMLKKVTQHLVDVHGQSEHFYLLDENNQLKVLDGLCGEGCANIKGEIFRLITEKKKIIEKIASFGGSEEERARKLDILNFQIDEIQQAEVREGEIEELRTKQSLILNSGKILSVLNNVKMTLDADGGCCDGLNLSVKEFDRISGLDREYAQIYTRLENLATEIADINETLSDLADNISFDENEAQFVENRLNTYKNLIKKYGINEKEILTFLENAVNEKNLLENSVSYIDKLTDNLNEIDDKIYRLCVRLTELRKNFSLNFCEKVENELKSLNIKDAKFNVKFKEYDREHCNLNSSNGADTVSFEFSANKGEPLKPLNKVISGGEMSRFMLALKTLLKDLNGISTYIFDEIDAGVSGYTAGKVAEKFIEISKNTQILAVSHLPQVCAASDSQFLIYKQENGNKTVTKVEKLSEKRKIDEIIRLTGNINSETSALHAEELITQYKKLKQR